MTRRAVEGWGRVDVALRDAAIDAGHRWCEDLNAPDSAGVSPIPFTQRDGVRVSTNDAYLEPSRTRPNLQVVGGALVDRVLIHGDRAIGVRVRVGGRWLDELADEIIVSAGAIHSPAVLMRSGIGSAARLGRLGIPVVADRPGVGANLREHPMVYLALALKAEARQLPTEIDNFANCYLRFDPSFHDDSDLLILAGNPGALGAALMRVTSTGRVDITTSNPQASPDVSFQMLSNPLDLAALRQGARHMFELAAHPAVNAIADAVLVGTTGASPRDLASDAELDEWLVAECGEFHHPCGTCRMGADSDSQAVVDAEGRVIGVAGLRVADASIFPNLPRANTNLTAIMVGEQISAMMSARAAT